MALRFGNALFEPLWRRESIANIQITLAESIGVGTRGDFYDRTGALRDMIQNHALQLLTMVAMEPPSRNDRRCDPRREAEGAALAQAVHARERRRATSCAASTAPATSTASAVPGFLEEAKVPRRQHDRDLRRAAHRGRRTGAGPACRSTCAPASASPSATRRSSSTSGATPHTHLSRAANRPNKLVIKLQPEDGLELHLLAAKGARDQARGARAGLARPRLRQGVRRATASAPTSGCCSTSSPAGSTCSCAATSRRRRGAGSSRSSRPGAATTRAPRPYAAGTLGPGRGERAGRARRLRLGRGAVAVPRAEPSTA